MMPIGFPPRIVAAVLSSALLLSHRGATAEEATGQTIPVAASGAELADGSTGGAGGVADIPEHPLAPATRWARQWLANIDKFQDYSCTFAKRERIDGELSGHHYMDCKVRRQPFSVYMHFTAPSNVKGQEVLYVAGCNDGQLRAHGVGIKAFIGTISLRPTASMAMEGNRHPITEFGIRNLAVRFIEGAERDGQYGECEVKFIEGAKLNRRSCTVIEIVHPVERSEFDYHIARVFVDDELQIPVRFESYGWPTQPGEKPPLNEEYTYLKLKFDNGYTDADFDEGNAAYDF
jgi:hypothetical protein